MNLQNVHLHLMIVRMKKEGEKQRRRGLSEKRWRGKELQPKLLIRER